LLAASHAISKIFTTILSILNFYLLLLLPLLIVVSVCGFFDDDDVHVEINRHEIYFSVNHLN
jgi:hypothetical protein